MESIPPDSIKNAIDAKKEHIETAQQPRLERINARREAYQRMVDCAKKGMEEYYKKFPERAVDVRSQDAENWSINGLSAIFDILDEYYITKRMENTNVNKSPESGPDKNAKRP